MIAVEIRQVQLPETLFGACQIRLCHAGGNLDRSLIKLLKIGISLRG